MLKMPLVSFVIFMREGGGGAVNVFCRGSSGAILAALFVSFLPHIETQIIHVKKDGESSHSSKVTGFDAYNMNVIIDDFICSGETIREIYNNISANKFVAIDVLIVESGYRNSLGFEPEYLITK